MGHDCPPREDHLCPDAQQRCARDPRLLFGLRVQPLDSSPRAGDRACHAFASGLKQSTAAQGRGTAQRTLLFADCGFTFASLHQSSRARDMKFTEAGLNFS